MGTLPHYLYTQGTHEIARNTVPYNNASDKRVANCDHLIGASISQNDEELNDNQCKLKETDKFSEEIDFEEENTGLVGNGRFGRAIKNNHRLLEQTRFLYYKIFFS